MRKKIFFLCLPACMALFLAGCHSFKRGRHKGKCCGHSQAFSGRAEIKPVKRGGPYGTAHFKNAGRHKIEVAAEIKGLPPGGQFGFHVHEWGACGNKALMAGGHFNPHKSRHGGAEGQPRHLGDLGNLSSDEKGRAVYRAEIHGKAQKFFGRALVIHAGRDDLKTQPSGDSKGRIACGVIAAAPAAIPAKKAVQNAEDSPPASRHQAGSHKPQSASKEKIPPAPEQAASGKAKKPAAPEAAEEPAAPEAAEKPAAPEAAEKPAAPEAAEKPAAPEAAEKPAAPEAAEKPAAPKAVEEPAAPEAAEKPGDKTGS